MNFKEKVQNGCNIIGTHVNLIDANITEIFGKFGYDYIWVDLEHTRICMDNLYEHILAARTTGTPVIVRVPVNDLTVTKRTLEMGVDGCFFHARVCLYGNDVQGDNLHCRTCDF